MSKEYKEKKIHSYERKLYEPLGEHGNSVYERREQLKHFVNTYLLGNRAVTRIDYLQYQALLFSTVVQGDRNIDCFLPHVFPKYDSIERYSELNESRKKEVLDIIAGAFKFLRNRTRMLIEDSKFSNKTSIKEVARFFYNPEREKSLGCFFNIPSYDDCIFVVNGFPVVTLAGWQLTKPTEHRTYPLLSMIDENFETDTKAIFGVNSENRTDEDELIGIDDEAELAGKKFINQSEEEKDLPVSGSDSGREEMVSHIDAASVDSVHGDKGDEDYDSPFGKLAGDSGDHDFLGSRIRSGENMNTGPDAHRDTDFQEKDADFAKGSTGKDSTFAGDESDNYRNRHADDTVVENVISSEEHVVTEEVHHNTGWWKWLLLALLIMLVIAAILLALMWYYRFPGSLFDYLYPRDPVIAGSQLQEKNDTGSSGDMPLDKNGKPILPFSFNIPDNDMPGGDDGLNRVLPENDGDGIPAGDTESGVNVPKDAAGLNGGDNTYPDTASSEKSSGSEESPDSPKNAPENNRNGNAGNSSVNSEDAALNIDDQKTSSGNPVNIEFNANNQPAAGDSTGDDSGSSNDSEAGKQQMSPDNRNRNNLQDNSMNGAQNTVPENFNDDISAKELNRTTDVSGERGMMPESRAGTSGNGSGTYSGNYDNGMSQGMTENGYPNGSSQRTSDNPQGKQNLSGLSLKSDLKLSFTSSDGNDGFVDRVWYFNEQGRKICSVYVNYSRINGRVVLTRNNVRHTSDSCPFAVGNSITCNDRMRDCVASYEEYGIKVKFDSM
ncbi:MAG: hypothetical protein IJ839_00365 [Ruminobacter sp.]|nr:hypothetical protein [Ruminobacter sp.]